MINLRFINGRVRISARWVERLWNRRVEYWANHSSAHSFAHTAHSLAPELMGKRFLSMKWTRRFHTVSTYCAAAQIMIFKQDLFSCSYIEYGHSLSSYPIRNYNQIQSDPWLQCPSVTDFHTVIMFNGSLYIISRMVMHWHFLAFAVSAPLLLPNRIQLQVL